MDLFYFNSPSEPAAGRRDSGLKWRGKPSTKRRKVGSIMDSSPYRAHVVRVAEPTVVANDLSAVSSYYLNALLDAGYLPSPSSSPRTITGQTFHSPTPKPEDEAFSLEQPAANDASTPPLDSTFTRNTSHIDHPRPESSDLWEEEDGRRIRFAFSDENDDHVARLSRSYVHSNTSPPSEPALTLPGLFDPRNEGLLPPFRTSPRSTDPLDLFLPQPLPLHSFAERFALPLPSSSPLPLHSTSQLIWDDNLLAVDDHRRSYDFADSMDEWRSRSSHGRAMPTFKPVIGPSTWRKPERDYIRSNAHTDGCDMQGLSWQTLGVQRRSALKARRLLHPHSTRNPTGDIESANNDDLHYKPRAFAPNHQARFSHYQLRNVTATGSGRNVYYAQGAKVYKASLSSPSAKRTVIDLERPSRSAAPFKVTCLSTSGSSDCETNEVLIAGGFNGEYAILDLNSKTSSKPLEGIASHAKDGIVNHIDSFRDRQSGSLRAAFCSNDHTVRVMDTCRQQFVGTFDYDSALNCSAMSPDGRLRALVHDGSDSWITSADTGEILVKLEAHTDFAFACAWSTCGRYVATGAEDHQVVVWDARNWTRPLQKLDCVMSCARSLHFHDDGALVIAESEDVVSIVDTATFGLRQDILLFGSIAGLSLLDGGTEMVVANADQTVGGLMSFERQPRGQRNGGFGREFAGPHGSRQQGRKFIPSIVEEMFV